MYMRISPWHLLIALLSAVPAGAQELTFPIRKDFAWGSVEKQVSKDKIDDFIKKTPEEFGYYRQKVTDYHSYNLDSLRRCLHFLDINGDNLLDVVFYGQSAGEPMEIEIFINKGDSYKKVFSDMQGISKIEWRDNRLSKLYIFDWGCCAAYIDYGKIYQIVFDKPNIPDFVQIYQEASIHFGENPDTLLEKPTRFIVLNNNYNIRFAPIIDDTSFQIWDDERTLKFHGNIIGKLPKGARGYALGKKRDSSSREWWYVEIDEEYFPIGYAFTKENEKFPTKVTGWISSRFVTEF